MAAEAVYWGMPTIIWVGRNNISDPTTIKADIAAMVAVLASPNYLVVGVTPSASAGEANTGPNYGRLVTLNSDLAAIYGAKFYDAKAYLQTQGDGSAQDDADIALDLIPSSKLSDGLHMNATGYSLLAAQFKAALGL